MSLLNTVREHKKKSAIIGGALVLSLGVAGTWHLLRADGAQAYTDATGDVISGVQEFLDATERESWRPWITEQEAETLGGDGYRACFAATQGESTLLPVVVCGPSLHPGQNVGGFDSHAIVKTTEEGSDGSVTSTLVLDPDAEWDAGASMPIGAVLSRPDGLQPLDAGDLVRPEPLEPIIRTEYINREVIVEVEGEPRIVEVYRDVDGKQVITPAGTTTVQSAGRADTVTTPDGSDVRAPAGQEFMVIEHSTEDDPNAPEGTSHEPVVVVGDQEVPLPTKSPLVLLVDKSKDVVLEVEFDGEQQIIDLRTGKRGGDLSSRLAWLYDEDRGASAYPSEQSNVRSSDTNSGIYSATVESIDRIPYVDGIGWGEYYAVNLSGESFQCSQAGYSDAVVRDGDGSTSAITHERSRLVADSVLPQAPVQTRVENGANTVLFFEADGMDATSFEVRLAPDVHCNVKVVMSDGYTDYRVSVPDSNRVRLTSETAASLDR